MTQSRLRFSSPVASTAATDASSRRAEITPPRSGAAWLVLSLGVCWVTAGCDGAAPAVDASTPVSAHTSAVSLRIDVSPGQTASLSVLAFRAAFSGVAAGEVLGMVDPLAADAPAHDCQLRDVDQAAAALVARGDAIELEELSGIAISVAANNSPEIRPSPRLYPDLAATIGGVVGEAGPLRLIAVPEQVGVRGAGVAGAVPDSSASGETASVGVPITGWVRLLNGSVPGDGIVIPSGTDLSLNVTPPDATGTSIELRPFGATVALSCAVPVSSIAGAAVGGLGAASQIAFMVPRQALAGLMVAAGGPAGAPVAAALDLVRRSNKTLPLSSTRVSLEVRTSTFVELRP